MTLHGWKNERTARFDAATLAAIQDAKQDDDTSAFRFECQQHVYINNPKSRCYKMLGIITSRRGGKPNRYTVRVGLVGMPFREDELLGICLRPLPVTGRVVTLFGRTLPLHSEECERLAARKRQHYARQKALRIERDQPIELPKVSLSALLQDWRWRQKAYRYMDELLARRKLAKAA